MSLYQRGRIWWGKFPALDGGRSTRESARTPDRAAAQEWYDRRRAELWRQARLGDRPHITWDQAALDWWDSHAQHKRSANDDRLRLRDITRSLTGLALDDIRTQRLTAVRDALRARLANGTCNRYLAIVSAVLHHAHAREWIGAVPRIPYLPEPRGRIDWLTRAQACALCRELPLHLGALALLSLATGLRQRNATHLEWSQIDTARRLAWIHPDQAKAGDPIAVPLNADALAALDLQRGAHWRWVFPWRGRPMDNPAQVAWQRACAAIGKPGFVWHGLRHTWASWHVQAGTPLEVLQQLGGWKSYAMVLKYAHLAPGYVASYAERVTLGTIQGTAPDQPPVIKMGETTTESVGWRMGLEPTTTGITILPTKRKA